MVDTYYKSVSIEEKFNEILVRIVYDSISFRWEELDIKLFKIIFNYFPLCFGIHNDFIEKDKDSISHEKFLNVYRCFISIYKTKKGFFGKSIKRECISMLIKDKSFLFFYAILWNLLVFTF